MLKSTHFNSRFIILGIPLFLICGLVLLTQSAFFNTNSNFLSIAIIVDLLLIIPFIYFLLIRKKNIPNTSIVPFFILGLIIGFTIIPKENQLLLEVAKTWVLPLVELGVLSYVSFKIYKATQVFKQKRNTSSDFFTIAKNTCVEIVPKKIALLLATELSVIYYGFINWKKRRLKENEFSYHKNTGNIVLLVAIIGVVFIETLVFHIIIEKWSAIVAWIFSGLSIYTALQIFALLKSIPKRPILVEDRKLHLRYGILNETIINIDNIEKLETTTREIKADKETRKLSPFSDMEGHNIIIKLKQENILYGFYGFNKNYKNIVFFVDEKEAFKSKIDSIINS